MDSFFKTWLKNRNGDIELDQLGKLILGLIFFILLIYIVSVVIRGELEDQGDGLLDAFNIFK